MAGKGKRGRKRGRGGASSSSSPSQPPSSSSPSQPPSQFVASEDPVFQGVISPETRQAVQMHLNAIAQLRAQGTRNAVGHKLLECYGKCFGNYFTEDEAISCVKAELPDTNPAAVRNVYAYFMTTIGPVAGALYSTESQQAAALRAANPHITSTAGR